MVILAEGYPLATVTELSPVPSLAPVIAISKLTPVPGVAELVEVSLSLLESPTLMKYF